MKRTIKHPDGREELIEGSPEEIAEYERKLKQESPKPKKKDILKGAPMEGADTCPCEACVRVRDWFKTVPQVVPMEPYPTPYPSITPWIGEPLHGGMCACPKCVPQWTITTTSDTLPGTKLYEYNPASSELKLQ